MSETYCGKSCSECEHREQLHCPGCKTGPGRKVSGGCAIARCCRSSRREDCSSCAIAASCKLLGPSQQAPEDRIQRSQTEHQSRTVDPEIARLFWALFWVSLVDLLASGLISLACLIAYAVIYWKLCLEEERYLKVLVLSVVAGVLTTVFGWLDSIFLLMIIVPISVFCDYIKHAAHADIAGIVDRTLSEKWIWLWKLHIWQYCAAGILILLLLIGSAGFLKLPTLALKIFNIVLSVMNLIYLYQTAKALQTHASS